MTAVSDRSVGVGDRAHPFLVHVLALLVGVAFTFSGTASFADGGSAGPADPDEIIEPSQTDADAESDPESDLDPESESESEPEMESESQPEMESESEAEPEMESEHEAPEAEPEGETEPCRADEDETDIGETVEGSEPTEEPADCDDTVEVGSDNDSSEAGPDGSDGGMDAPAEEHTEEHGEEHAEEPADDAGSDGPAQDAEPQPDPDPESESELESDADPEPQPDADPEPADGVDPDPQSDAEPDADPEASEPTGSEPEEEPAAFSETSTTIDESDTPLTVTLSGPAAVFRVVGDGTILEDAPLAPVDSGQQLNFSNQSACPAVISIVHAAELDLGPYALRVRYDPGSGAETIPEAVIVGTKTETELIPFLDVPEVEGGHAGFEKPLEFRLFTATEANPSNSATTFAPGDSITVNLTFVIESTDCPAGSDED
jgi:hypothetical protein